MVEIQPGSQRWTDRIELLWQLSPGEGAIFVVFFCLRRLDCWGERERLRVFQGLDRKLREFFLQVLSSFYHKHFLFRFFKPGSPVSKEDNPTVEQVQSLWVEVKALAKEESVAVIFEIESQTAA